MNLEHTEVLLKKINRLYELIKSFGEASETERDLLKAYVIDLYEAVAMSEIEAPKELDEKEMKEKIKKIKKQEKKLKKQVSKNKAAVDYELDEDTEPMEENPADEKIEKAEEPKEEVKSPQVPQEMIDLFEFSNSSELSDKLANAPVKDLTKAMGINEKIFTVKELFGGKNEELDNMLEALNGLSDFNEARSVLIRSVASKYDWTAPGRSKKAKNFIKLVRRRYL